MRPVLFAAVLALVPFAAHGEFLNPDLAKLSIESISEPDWITGVRDGAYIGMCVTCDGTVMFQVQVLNDDGTGGRVRSGETSAEDYTAIGEANAQQIGGEADYLGTNRIDFASAVGFRTEARIATGDYSVTYQLWSDGKQLIVRVYGPDKDVVDSLAENAYRAAAPLTFR